MIKTGLFFGSYNPIHVGHVIIAQHLLANSDLTDLWFVVTPHNPHKNKQTLLEDRQRLHMVNLALPDPYHMRACDDEFALPQPSYTITTLTHLAEKYPDRDFSLIMGQDNLASFHKWKNHELILERHDLYIYPRYGDFSSRFDHNPKVHHIAAPKIELSATEIRKAIKDKKNISAMLPPKVWKYIQANSFYQI